MEWKLRSQSEQLFQAAFSFSPPTLYETHADNDVISQGEEEATRSEMLHFLPKSLRQFLVRWCPLVLFCQWLQVNSSMIR